MAFLGPSGPGRTAIQVPSEKKVKILLDSTVRVGVPYVYGAAE
jgi:hypothetical protein